MLVRTAAGRLKQKVASIIEGFKFFLSFFFFFGLGKNSKPHQFPRVCVLTSQLMLGLSKTAEKQALSRKPQRLCKQGQRVVLYCRCFPLIWQSVCLSIATQEGVARPKLARLCQVPEALLWKTEAPPLDVRRPYQSARLQKRKPLAALK